MVNYDYKKFLQENKQHSYQNILEDYSYHDDVSALIYRRINNLDSFDEEEVKSIINLITLWKVDRINGSTNDTLKSLCGWIRNVSLKEEDNKVKFVSFETSLNKEVDVEPKIKELLLENDFEIIMFSEDYHDEVSGNRDLVVIAKKNK